MFLRNIRAAADQRRVSFSQKMKINRALNIVIPVETSAGKIFVHSTPISTEVFDLYWETLSQAYNEIAKKGAWLTAPRFAFRELRKAAIEMPRKHSDGTITNWWDGIDGVENGLINEVRRLTSFVLPQQGAGWTTIPFVDENTQKSLDAEDIRDIEALLVFFTVLSASPVDRRGREEFLRAIAKPLQWHLTSLNATEFSRSPEISKLIEDSGKKDRTS